MNYKNGTEFLNYLYKDMHMDDNVIHTASPSDKPTEKIDKYLDRLERVHDMAKDRDRMNLLLKFYYNKYVIKELPESYINLQKKIAKNEGHGDIEITDQMKDKYLETIREDQKTSLKMWVDYLTSDDAMYPMWFKHYAFRGMVGLGSYDKEKHEFSKRSKDTTSPFIDLNRAALANVYDTLVKKMNSEVLSDEQLKTLENGESFKKLYSHYLQGMLDQTYSHETDGIWVKYNQGDDYKKLWESLQGKNTGWCTEGEATCKQQIKDGDFHVYYTKDEENNYVNPRIAIRMDGKYRIGEIRGIDKDQNLEGCMTRILDKKLTEFPDAENYKKKTNDMEMLTYIYTKWERNKDIHLSKDELKFLYEINSKIEGFGWQIDPRIKEILNGRDIKKDLSYALDCMEDQITDDFDDCFVDHKDIVYYKGNCILRPIKHFGVGEWNFKLPKYVTGDVNLERLITTEDLELPIYIGGSLNLESLETAEGLNLPKYVGADLNLSGLTSAEGLRIPITLKDCNIYLPDNIDESEIEWYDPNEEEQELMNDNAKTR